MSNHSELEYEEYLQRRQATALQPRTSASRFEPVAHAEDSKGLQGSGLYDLPNNEYRSAGYDDRPSLVGSDPIAAVRTLRNNLRSVEIAYRDADQPVKSHVCRSACEELSTTEHRLVDLSHERSQAIVRGDVARAEGITNQMEKVKSDAIRNAYSDLMIDDAQMKAFGVNSKWTPDKNPSTEKMAWRPISPAPPPKRAITPLPRRRPASSDRFRPDEVPQRQKTPTRPTSRRPSLNREKTPTRRPPSQKGLKKNERLADYMGRGANTAMPVGAANVQNGIQDDPYKAPTYIAQCPHCELIENGLSRPGALEKHYARSCKMMVICKFCLKAVLIPLLTDHYVNRCEFLRDQMEPCFECGLSISRDDQANHASHPLCRGRQPPPGAVWCQLCSIAVNDQREDWLRHVNSECYNHPRRNGPERDPRDVQREQQKLKEQEKQKEAQLAAEAKEAQKKEQKHTIVQQQTPGYNGRMIDADKLAVALQQIQERKKAEKRKKLKEVEAQEAKEDVKPAEPAANAKEDPKKSAKDGAKSK